MTEDQSPEAAAEGSQVNSISPELLELLVCPLGKEPLRRKGDRLICSRCGLIFRIENGYPNMIVEDAELPEGVGSLDELACQRQQGQ